MSEAVDNDSIEQSAYAEPGYDDLTCDLEDVTIQSVLTMDGIEIMATFVGGSGWMHHEGAPIRFDNLEEMQLMGGLVDTPEHREIITMVVNKMEEWRRAGTKLRLLAAEGKITTLVEARDRWIPLPFVVGS